MTAQTRDDTYAREHFFKEELPLSDSTRQVLETYSNISPDQVLPHVYAIVRRIYHFLYNLHTLTDRSEGKSMVNPSLPLHRLRTFPRARHRPA